MLIAADLKEMHSTVDTLAQRRRAQSVATKKNPPPSKVKGWRSTMSPAELAAHKGLVPR